MTGAAQTSPDVQAVENVSDPVAHVRLSHLVAAAVPLALAASLTPGASAVMRDEITPRSTQAIDTSSRSEVRAAYTELWRAADERQPRWIGGTVKACENGRLARG